MVHSRFSIRKLALWISLPNHLAMSNLWENYVSILPDFLLLSILAYENFMYVHSCVSLYCPFWCMTFLHISIADLLLSGVWLFCICPLQNLILLSILAYCDFTYVPSRIPIIVHSDVCQFYICPLKDFLSLPNLMYDVMSIVIPHPILRVIS